MKTVFDAQNPIAKIRKRVNWLFHCTHLLFFTTQNDFSLNKLVIVAQSNEIRHELKILANWI